MIHPQPVREYDRRSRRRAELETPVHVDIDGNTRSAVCRDVSTGGICVRTDDAFDVGSHVTVDFTVPGAGEVRVDAEVAWTAGDRVGFRFRRLGAAALTNLVGFVAR